MLQRIGALVVVRVERFARRAAPELGLFVGHLLFGTGEEPAGRNTCQGESVEVGAAVKAVVLRRFSGAANPFNPDSSVAQNPNRTALFTCGELPSCSAVSCTAVTPEPMSLIPGPPRHAVQVRTDHHHVGGGTGLGLGDDVAGLLGPDAGVQPDGDVAGVRPQPGTVGLGDANDRDLDIGPVAEGVAHL